MPIAKVNGQGIYFEDSGGSGPAIVFLHGFLMDQSLFDAQVEKLAPHYRCIRWDARGFGKTQWDGKPFNLYDSAADCIGLMDHLNIDSAVLTGMSQGGYCALRTALEYPKRVKGLILVSTQAGIEDEVSKAAYQEMRDVWKQHGPIPPLVEAIATAIIGPREVPGIEAYWSQWLPRWKETPPNAFFEAITSLINRDDITDQIKAIQCPALVLHGNDDLAMPPIIAENMSKALSGCKGFHTVPGAHAVIMTQAKLLNPFILEFLEKWVPAN